MLALVSLVYLVVLMLSVVSSTTQIRLSTSGQSPLMFVLLYIGIPIYLLGNNTWNSIAFTYLGMFIVADCCCAGPVANVC